MMMPFKKMCSTSWNGVRVAFFLSLVLAGCLAESGKKDAADCNEAGHDHPPGQQHGHGQPEVEKEEWNTPLIVCVIIAVAITIAGCYICNNIRKKSEDRYATGDNLPKNLAPMSAKI